MRAGLFIHICDMVKQIRIKSCYTVLTVKTAPDITVHTGLGKIKIRFYLNNITAETLRAQRFTRVLLINIVSYS